MKLAHRASRAPQVLNDSRLVGRSRLLLYVCWPLYRSRDAVGATTRTGPGKHAAAIKPTTKIALTNQ